MISSKGPIYSFFIEYREKSPGLLFFLMFITGGLYLIWWIFKLTRNFEEKGIDAPSSKRGLVVMIAFPFVVGGFFMLLENYFGANAVLESFKLVVFYFLIILQLKFLYDFSVTFSNVTATNPLWWYYSLFFWFLSIVLLYFQSYYTLIFMFFPITAIPAMQSFMNKRFETFKKKEKSESFNYKVRQA